MKFSNSASASVSLSSELMLNNLCVEGGAGFAGYIITLAHARDRPGKKRAGGMKYRNIELYLWVIHTRGVILKSYSSFIRRPTFKATR